MVCECDISEYSVMIEEFYSYQTHRRAFKRLLYLDPGLAKKDNPTCHVLVYPSPSAIIYS